MCDRQCHSVYTQSNSERKMSERVALATTSSNSYVRQTAAATRAVFIASSVLLSSAVKASSLSLASASGHEGAIQTEATSLQGPKPFLPPNQRLPFFQRKILFGRQLLQMQTWGQVSNQLFLVCYVVVPCCSLSVVITSTSQSAAVQD